MGFYDKKIKDLYEKCPRLVILSINSIFHKKHKPDAEIVYLDKEQSGENETFMDMLLEVEGCKYHFEFQLLEGNMAIRMYEYSVKETIRELLHEGNQDTETKEGIELFEYHKQMKNSLEKLYEDDIITVDEYNYLIESFSDVEGYLVDKDEMVKQEVVEMGDNDYVCRSERARQEGLAEGREVGLAEGRKVGLTEGRMTEVYSSVLEGDYGIKRGAEKLGLSEEEFVKRMEEAGYQVPVEAENI